MCQKHVARSPSESTRENEKKKTRIVKVSRKSAGIGVCGDIFFTCFQTNA